MVAVQVMQRNAAIIEVNNDAYEVDEVSSRLD